MTLKCTAGISKSMVTTSGSGYSFLCLCPCACWSPQAEVSYCRLQLIVGWPIHRGAIRSLRHGSANM